MKRKKRVPEGYELAAETPCSDRYCGVVDQEGMAGWCSRECAEAVGVDPKELMTWQEADAYLDGTQLG